MEENLEFSLTQKVLEYTGNHVFLTGKAGTGKTTFLQHFYSQTSKNAIITAPTGVAAINAGGTTLHSMFNLPFQAYIPSLMSVDKQLALNNAEIRKQFRFNKSKLEVLRKLDVLIIDEISMVRADMLDAIHEALKYARRNEKAFGGVQLLLIGDLFQLPPVVQQEEWNILKQWYASPYFFDAKIMQSIPMVSVELKHIYRQTDGQFISLLNDIRNNQLEEYSYQLLNERYYPNFSNDEKIITLCTHNKQADEINQKNLQSLETKSYGYYAEIEGKFPESAYPMPTDLELKEGAKVMFIKNDSSNDKRYYNGKIVEVVELNEEEIWVKMDDEKELFKLQKEEWQNKKYEVNEENEIEEDVIGVFRHFPIRLAWAITIHKSQGLTFDEVVVDAGKAFAPGQVYVALSRCTQLDGVFLTSRINPQNLFLDDAVQRFQNELWNTEAIEEILETQRKPYALEQLFSSLNFQEPLRMIQRWIVYLHKNPNTYQEEISDVQVQVEKALKELIQVVRKFQNVAYSKYQEDPDSDTLWQEIEELSQKAITYFLVEFTTKVFQKVKYHIDDMEKKSRTTTYLKEIYPLELYLEGIIQQLKKSRLMDTSLFSYDTESTQPSKPTSRTKKKSHEITLEFLQENLSIEDIALARNLGITTIENHIIQLIEEDKIENLETFVSATQLQEIQSLLPKDFQDISLKKLYEKLDKKYSYFELRLAKIL